MTNSKEAKKCRMCGKANQLIKAHLLPNGLKRVGENFKGTGDYMVGLSLKSPESWKVQTLEFDSGILCASCDGTLGRYDQVLIKFVKDWYWSPVRLEPIKRFRPPPVYKYCCNTEELKLAFAAIMFRCAISSRYEGAKIGKTYEATFSEWLTQGCIRGERCNDLNVWIFGMSRAPYGLCNQILNGPAGDRFMFVLEMYGLIVFIKVGGRPAPESIRGYPDICTSSDFIKFQIMPFEQSFVPEISDVLDNARAKKALDIGSSTIACKMPSQL